MTGYCDGCGNTLCVCGIGRSIEQSSDSRKMATVPMWVVVYAIRYGIRRQSYARTDAFRLALDYWDDLDDPPDEDVPECPSCGVKAMWGGRAWESYHSRDCAWMADPDSESY